MNVLNSGIEDKNLPTEISDSFDNVLKYSHIFLKFSNFSLVPFGGLI